MKKEINLAIPVEHLNLVKNIEEANFDGFFKKNKPYFLNYYYEDIKKISKNENITKIRNINLQFDIYSINSKTKNTILFKEINTSFDPIKHCFVDAKMKIIVDISSAPSDINHFYLIDAFLSYVFYKFNFNTVDEILVNLLKQPYLLKKYFLQFISVINTTERKIKNKKIDRENIIDKIINEFKLNKKPLLNIYEFLFLLIEDYNNQYLLKLPIPSKSIEFYDYSISLENDISKIPTIKTKTKNNEYISIKHEKNLFIVDNIIFKDKKTEFYTYLSLEKMQFLDFIYHLKKHDGYIDIKFNSQNIITQIKFSENFQNYFLIESIKQENNHLIIEEYNEKRNVEYKNFSHFDKIILKTINDDLITSELFSFSRKNDININKITKENYLLLKMNFEEIEENEKEYFNLLTIKNDILNNFRFKQKYEKLEHLLTQPLSL